MKKLQVFVLSFMMIFTTFNLNVSALSNNQEMRAAWISTVYNMDWPSTKNNQSKQKQEYIALIDKLKASGINTVVVQVRPKGDAMYKSNINPWSEYLTGTQGKDPGYDPLPFLIDEAHKRGMEFHAWFNPYRVTTSTTDLRTLAANHPARLNPSWVIQHKNGAYQALAYNPGLPEVRKHIVDSVSEVVRNYNIDGVHFDDYFYRDGMNDDETYKKYGNGRDKGDWRRDNVNTLLREVKSSIKSIKSNVDFGVSPSGIWRNKSSDPTGSDTRGQESYSDLFADSRAWIKQGLVDYIVPQVYWPIGFSAADYSKLVSWWSNEVKGTNVKLYIGQGVYKQGESSNGNQNVAAEIKEQINLNRQYGEIKGSMYFSASDITRNDKLQSDMKELYTSPQWSKDSYGNWYLKKIDGKQAANEWEQVGGVWYRFAPNGRMLENEWFKDSDGIWYYLKQGGMMISNEWEQVGGIWYRFEPSGKMLESEWFKDSDGIWYYLKRGGMMASNEWEQVGGIWYRFEPSGKMLESEWFKDSDGIWYYLKRGGMMASNEWEQVGGVWYRFEPSGKMLESEWFKDSDGIWYYLKRGGMMASNEKLYINGTMYKFSINGNML